MSCFQYTITANTPDGQSTTPESDGVGASAALLDAINRLTAFLLVRLVAPGAGV